MRPRRLVPVLIVAGAAATAFTACTGNGSATTTTTSIPATTTTEPERVDDGVLKLGVLLPTSGDGAAIGQPLVQAVNRAVEEINGAGGVNSSPVELVAADEGASTDSATDAIATLLDENVDAVIGPASSNIALATLQQLVGAGVLTCSPTATALALDGFPDDDGLFFRTIASDSMQAEAIANRAGQTGARTAAVAFLDDAYGRPLAETTIAALGRRGLTDIEQVPFTTDDEAIIDAATQLGDSRRDVIVVIADADRGSRLLTAIGENATLSGAPVVPDIIVSAALRNPPSPQAIADLPAAVRDKLQGVSVQAVPASEEAPPGAFATNAYDCANLIALAAVQSGVDNPREIAAELDSVSVEGSPCRSFPQCNSLLEERNIDYDGPSGLLRLSPDGTMNQAVFDVFGFDEAGAERAVDSIVLG
jgi:branched-chain amino acid transport system substrate-binding protein